MAIRYQRSDRVVCCFAGDGAFANGVVLESLNWAAQDQWTNHLAADRPYGLPIIFFIQNNHYGMTHRTDDEVMGVPYLAQRAWGFAENGMHAEVVNGMDVLAVRDAVRRATERCRAGEGPVLIEASVYRYYGHSLSDPRNEYRTREEEAAWRDVDPVARLRAQLLATGAADEATMGVLEREAAERNARAAQRAAASPDPDPEEVLTYLYTNGSSDVVPAEAAEVAVAAELPLAKRDASGAVTYKDAIREAIAEEMARDARVIHYGEDIADYGGAFKLTKGLLEAFGRDRVFNTPISEAAICGTAVGAAMAGTAADRRADVHGLRADGVGPDRQPGGEVALHVGRPCRGAARHPGIGRCGQGLRRPAQPVTRELVHATRPGSRSCTRRTRRTPRAC